MKLRSSLIFHSVVASLLTPFVTAAVLTWDGAPDGGGASTDGNWSTATNWLGDVVPAATNDTLIFSGSTNLNAVNDQVTSINVGTSITFAASAGSFQLSGANPLTLGSGGGGGITIFSQQSPNPQTVSLPINLSGGNGDRNIVFASGAGSLTLSGAINFSNDWLFPTTTAGTIILSGANTGDGKATNAITAGTNIMRAMMRNNVANTTLVIGNDSALGNAGTGSTSAGTASFRGVIANQNLFVKTDANRSASGSSIAINAPWLDFNSSANLEIGNVIVVGGNRDFKLTSSGSLTISKGVFLSQDQTARQLYNNLTGTGSLTVSGAIYDTMHSGGIVNRSVNDIFNAPVTSLFRKAGNGTMYLNGDSATTFTGECRIEKGVVVLGHANALGATTASYTFNQTGEIFSEGDQVTLVSSTGVAVGQVVTGTGIAPGTTVAAIDTVNHILTLSLPATVDNPAAVLTFAATRTAPTLVGKSPNFATLDLNGQTIAEPIHFMEGPGHDPGTGTLGVLINSNTTTPAVITADLTSVYSSTFGGPGDITVPRLISNVLSTMTKNGAGTFTSNGSSHNNLCAWVVNAGTVVFANTAGFASDRGTTIHGGTVKLSGLNPNLINDNQAFVMTGGNFDLNGKAEAVASIDGTAGTVTNSNAAAATLYVGGGNAGSSSATFAGVIQDGVGKLHLHKEGTGTQTLTGANIYTGNTTVSNGVLSLSSAFLADSSTVSIQTSTGGALQLSHGSTDIVSSLVIDGVPQGDGVYGAIGSGAEFETPAITGTGKIQVIAPLSGFVTWIGGSFANGSVAPADQDLSDDADGDGFSNLIEYAVAGMDPTVANAAIATQSGMTVTYSKRALAVTNGDVLYAIEESNDLGVADSWSEVTPTSNTTSAISYTFPGPNTLVKDFVRLKITKP